MLRSEVSLLYWKMSALRMVAFLCAVGTCWGQNLAQNPGFESGNTSGWFGFGGVSISAQTAIVRSGSYAGFVQGRTASWNGIAQSFLGDIQPGDVCNISVWARLASGSATAQLTMRKVDDAGTDYTAVSSTTISDGSWTQLSGQYTLTTSGTPTELTLYVELPSSASADFYADDLSVQVVNSGPSGVGGESVVQWTNLHQRIDGFGASSAWRSGWTSTQADMLFSTNSGTGVARDGTTFPFTGVGLSLLRTRIAPGATTVEQTIMQMAQARGASVWSAPWSPAAQFKSNNNVNGGSFVGTETNYGAYAAQLAGYVARMKAQYGVNIYALSVQNEPDANVTTYESCNWTAQQIHDFIPYLSSALTASNVAATRIMLPESQNWTDPQGLHSATMNDSQTASLVGIIANHNYVANNNTGDQSPPAALNSYGKALWETEVSKLSGNDSSIDDGLYWAGRVHQFLTLAQANAWHYWWLYAYGTSNEGLCDTNEVPAKRMYSLGNFSRFVRPGFHRVGVSSTGTSSISAYRSLTNRAFAIVAINGATNSVVQTFSLAGFSAPSVTPWITSAGASLASQAALPVTNNAFAFTIPAKSVVTFTGTAYPSNSPPALTPVADQTTGVGLEVTVTNLATDPDIPPQTLTFTLLNAPTNAVLNATNGLLSWRPLVAQAQTTNLIRVKVSDDGSPAMSATNSYFVTVVPLTAPSFSTISASSNHISLTITGALGPTYALEGSTNLTQWDVVQTTNPTSIPVILVDTNRNYPRRFYRIGLGP